MENKEISLWRKIVIGIIAFVGFVTTIKLAMIYYNANFSAAPHASFCSVNEFIDCDSVAKTIDSQFLGVPLAYWGMFLYLFIGLMMGAKKLAQHKLFKFMEVFKNPYFYISALGIISFTISIILLCISLFQIKKLCILCAFTYVLNLAIGLFAMDYSKGGFVNIFKTSFFDFRDALKIKKYLIAFISLSVLACGFLTFTAVTNVFSPHVKDIRALKKYVKMKEKGINPYVVKGNVLGNPEGDIKLHFYSDFRCPICAVYNIIINKVVQDFENVYVVHHNYPLDMECNKYMKRPFHFGSCALARYGYAAEQQGHYWDFANEVYLTQPLVDFDVWAIALKLGMDLDKLKADMMSADAEKVVQADIDEAAVELNIKGTPAVKINDSKEPHMGAMSDIALRKYLIKAGGKLKSDVK
ncbi:thioredoxin domain-containing protein [bacterium]|nr:thioredoxin domain-containing protein [bacterium]